MKIKTKLICFTVFAISALLSVVALTWTSTEKVIVMNKQVDNINKLKLSVLTLRHIESNFLLQGEVQYPAKFKQRFNRFQTEYSQLQQNLADFDVSIPALNNLLNLATNYQTAFNQLVDNYQPLDLNHNQALRGNTTAAADKVDTMLVDINQTLSSRIVDYENFMVRMTMTILLLLVGGLFLLSVIINNSIRQRISSLSDFIASITQNNDLTIIADINHNDELSQIEEDVNHLVSNFREVIGNVQNAVGELGIASSQLQDRSISSEETIKHQEGETNSVATAITQMSSTIHAIAANTESAANQAAQSQQGANEGLIEVKTTKTSIDTLSNDLIKASNEIDSLSQLSDSIGSVLGVIASIADQTNLLALNAAIEAARAGEQGRGFAVVADEVRSLSQRTSASTEEITSIIAKLQNQTSDVVVHINRCAEQGRLSVEQACSAETRIEQIMTDLQTIMGTSNQIATSIEQQSNVVDEIGQNVLSIQGLSRKNSDISQENTQVAYSVAAQSETLNSAITEYKV